MKTLPILALTVTSSLLIPTAGFAQAASSKPQSKPAMAAVAMPSIAQDSPTAMMNGVLAALKANQPVGLWAAVSPADRTTINQQLAVAATKIDPAVYNEAMKMVKRLGTLVDKNAQYLNTYMVQNEMAGGAMKKMSKDDQLKSTKLAGEMLSTLSASSLGSHAGLAKVDVGMVLSQVGGKLMSQAMGLQALAGGDSQDAQAFDMSKLSVGDVVEEGDVAHVTINGAGDGMEPLPMKKVDGKWWFNMDEELTEMKADIADMEPMSKRNAGMAKAVMGQMGGMLGKFDDIEGQEEFDEAFQQTMGMVMGMMMGGMPGGR